MQKIGSWLIFGVFLYAFVYQLMYFDWSGIKNIKIENVSYLLLAFILVGANWFCEWKKWIAGMKSIHEFSEELLRMGFYAGMVAGFITPSALGNFLGRMMAVNKQWKAKVVATTVMGNGAQFIVSLTFGILSFFFLQNLPEFKNSFWSHFLMLIFILFMCYMYFSIGKVALLKKIISRFVPSVSSVSIKIRGQFFLWSTIRYLIFSFQFFLIIKAFQTELSFVVLFWIWQLYLWTTLSPSIFMGKLFIRETLAIFILTHAGVELAVALTASIIVWLINNALPSMYAYFKWKHHVVVEA